MLRVKTDGVAFTIQGTDADLQYLQDVISQARQGGAASGLQVQARPALEAGKLYPASASDEPGADINNVFAVVCETTLQSKGGAPNDG